jgi:predicted nucleic acid-binding Zn ribbon protein
MRAMEKLSDIFQVAFSRGNLKKLRIFTLSWVEIVGEQAAKHSKPARYDNKILFVRASSPVWANQLQFLSPEIIKKINQKLGKNFVKEIRFSGIGTYGNLSNGLQADQKTANKKHNK